MLRLSATFHVNFLCLWQIAARQELQPGSEVELEIRGCTIHAVELLKSAISQRPDIAPELVPSAVQLDWWLWERGEARRTVAPPHHRVRTLYY